MKGLLIFDLDGTLLKSNKSISTRTVSALKNSNYRRSRSNY